jgi:diguanylate cyclase (GGDEF)-like protein
MLDQTTLLIAIGLTASGLMLTLVVTWLGTRRDRYLLSWGAGLALIVVSILLYGLFSAPYVPAMQFVTFALLTAGFALIHAGAIQFRIGRLQRPWLAVLACAAAIALTGAAFLGGWSGTGTMLANIWCALYFGLSGVEAWRGRGEARLVMWTQAVLFWITAASFLLCAAVLLLEGRWVLTARPDNWAEDLNSLVIVVAMAGIGALALAINQLRLTKAERRRASTDSLTGLLNRRALFADVADGALRDGTAVLMLDLDRFKTINDSFGHAVGDTVLIRFAEILRQSLRQPDRAARLGGEEFCVVLEGVGVEAALAVAERIRSGFAASEPLSAEFGTPTVSAGVAVAFGSDDSFETLLRHADTALYAAKQAGRNQVQGPALEQAA